MLIKNLQEFNKAKFSKLLAVDTETTSLNPREAKLEGVGWGDDTQQYYVDWGICDFKEEVLTKFKQVFKNNEIIFHNAKFDIKIFKQLFNLDYPEKIQDTMIMSWLLDENRQHGLKGLVKNVLKRKVVSYSEVPKKITLFDDAENLRKAMANYCCADVKNTFDLYKIFLPKMKEEDLLFSYNNIELPLIKVLSDMELKGVKINLDILKNLSKKAKAILLEKEALIYQLVGNNKFNIRSSKQLRELIFDKLGVEPEKMTPAGVPSTDNESLKLLIKKNSAVKAILDFREFDKLNGTYLVGLQEKAEDNILYTDFLQHRTRSGRLACVPLKNQILTERGWKFWNKIKVGELVMGFDIQKQEYIWTKLKNIHTGKGNVGIIKTNRGHGKKQGILCTEEHNWVVKNNNIIGFSKAKHIQRGFKVLLQSKSKFPNIKKSILNNYEASLLGWYLTDGFLTGKKNYGLGINLVKKRSIKLLEDLLQNKEFTTRKYQRIFPSGIDSNYVTAFHISSKVFNPIYEKLVNYSPDELILKMNISARKSMFGAMLEGDGSMRRNKKRYDRFGALLVQKKRTCEYFELLSVSLGQSYTNRVIKLPKTGNLFVGYHLLEKELYSDRNSNWKIEKNNEEVWCPETECGTWLMRQDNQIVITGNSANPNLQNIPARKDEFDVRKAFVARKGYKFIIADYSQIELRVIAFFSQEPSMIKIFQEGGDIHQLTADMVGCSRNHAKAINFGLIYGLGVKGLARDLEISIEQAKKYMNAFFRKYSKLSSYISYVQNTGLYAGYVTTLAKRRRRFKFSKQATKGEIEAIKRKLINTKVQGGSADLMKIAMVKVHRTLNSKEAHMLIQIHDEIVVEVKEENINKVQKIIKNTMEKVVNFNIPIPVDMQVADCWVK